MNLNCTICADLFTPTDNAFSTVCGHIFHHACIIQWLERSKSCPQCRFKCTEKNMIRIYFNTTLTLDTSEHNPSNLIEKIDNLQLQLREKDMNIKKIQEEINKKDSIIKTNEQKLNKLKISNCHNEQMVAQMKHEISIYSTRNSQYKHLEAENNELKTKIKNLNSVECILLASQEDIEDVIKRQYSTQELYTMVGALKRELYQNELKRNDLKKHLNLIKNDLKAERNEKNRLLEKLSDIESRVNETENLSVLKLPKKYEDNITPSNVKKRKILNEEKSPEPAPSNSPYFSVVRTGSSLLSTALKTPLGLKQDPIRTKTQGLSKLSIFNKKPHFMK